MLEAAKKYEDQLKKIYYENMFNPDYKWEWIGWGREWVEPSDKTGENNHFVSALNGVVLGEMGYHVDRAAKKADGLYCAHFSKDNGAVFSKDLFQMIRDIFERFHLNKLSYCVVVGNPIERKWDKLTSKFGGRIVGTRREDILLEDNRLYDVKEYEILCRDYRGNVVFTKGG